MNSPAPLDAWVTVAIGKLVLVSCPVCGSILNHHDTQALARHVLWHHNQGDWPWEKM